MIEKNSNRSKFLIALILIGVGLFSYFVISGKASSPQFHLNSIELLDQKKITVMELVAASATASTAISLIPGDTAMPIANQISSISSYLLIVICIIVVEKYLLTISGFITFSILIPIACISGVLYLFVKYDFFKSAAIKLTVFGIALFMLVPISVKVTNLIENTYQASIEQTIDDAKKSAEEIQTEEENGFLSGIISSVENATGNMVKKAEKMFSNFIDAVAVLIVTSCCIPVFVLLGLLGIIKMIFNYEVKVPKKMLPLTKGNSKKNIDRNLNQLIE